MLLTKREMNIVVLENKPISSIDKVPIEVIACVGLDGKSMSTNINFNKKEYDEIIIQKVNGENRSFDCIVICKKHNSSVSVYSAKFNSGFFK